MKNTFFQLLTVAFLFSCGGGPETITVSPEPLRPSAPQDTAEIRSSEGDEFIHISVGEFSPIESMDPLFAESNSELRIIHLIYDGLARLDDSGNPAPALAKDWEVNNDSTRFTFNLRTDVFFHDVNSFSGGVGRKFIGSDVRYVFERMASLQVPDYAAKMFENIRGFSDYHREQTYVKNAAKRAIDSINGIELQNDSTVVFTLDQSSPEFLRNLAHPFASVYASESATSITPPIQRPAGTGAFYYVTTDENRHVLAVNRNYYGTTPKMNRLDIVSGLSEGDLFQMFARDELDALVELSPSSISLVADSAGELTNSYSENDFQLIKTPVQATYKLFYNEESDQKKTVNLFLSTLNVNNIFENPVLGHITKHSIDTTNTNETKGGKITIAKTAHPSELYLINRIMLRAASLGFTASMNDSYAITEDVTFTTRTFPNTTEILTWNTPLFMLSQNNFSGIQINHEPWNMDAAGVSVSEEL